MKTKFIEIKGIRQSCYKCCHTPNTEACLEAPCVSAERADGKNGYFIRIKPRKNPGKHERLLKALLKCVFVYTDGEISPEKWLSEKQARELIAIKEKMEGGGK